MFTLFLLFFCFLGGAISDNFTFPINIQKGDLYNCSNCNPEEWIDQTKNTKFIISLPFGNSNFSLNAKLVPDTDGDLLWMPYTFCPNSSEIIDPAVVRFYDGAILEGNTARNGIVLENTVSIAGTFYNVSALYPELDKESILPSTGSLGLSKLSATNSPAHFLHILNRSEIVENPVFGLFLGNESFEGSLDLGFYAKFRENDTLLWFDTQTETDWISNSDGVFVDGESLQLNIITKFTTANYYSRIPKASLKKLLTRIFQDNAFEQMNVTGLTGAVKHLCPKANYKDFPLIQFLYNSDIAMTIYPPDYLQIITENNTTWCVFKFLGEEELNIWELGSHLLHSKYLVFNYQNNSMGLLEGKKVTIRGAKGTSIESILIFGLILLSMVVCMGGYYLYKCCLNRRSGLNAPLNS